MAHVLLVDDDPALRYLLHAVVQDDGHTTLEAADGVEALATLGDSRGPLIVLLDWQMPRLGGFGVLRAVAADPRLRALHCFVLVTAADWQQDRELTMVLEQLHVPVLPKPFDLATVSQVVEQAGTCLAAAWRLAVLDARATRAPRAAWQQEPGEDLERWTVRAANVAAPLVGCLTARLEQAPVIR